MRILETAIRRGIHFRVIIVDSCPQNYGRIKKISFVYLIKYYFRSSVGSKIIGIEYKMYLCTY